MSAEAKSESDAASALSSLLAELRESGGSDLLLGGGGGPRIRVDGTLRPASLRGALPPTDLVKCLTELCGTPSRSTVAVSIARLGRFRVHFARSAAEPRATVRAIPDAIPSLGELGLPDDLDLLWTTRKGLVLVAGRPGSGRSTTIAALVDRILKECPWHVVTLEDPIEHIHSGQKGEVTQHELGTDVASVDEWLRSVQREGADVVLLGEIDSLAKLRLASYASGWGILVFATLHARTIREAIEYLIAVPPVAEREGTLRALSHLLLGVLVQSLLPRTGAGRVLALEYAILDPPMREAIRVNDLDLLYRVMQTGSLPKPACTLNQSLWHLWAARRISLETAFDASPDPHELRKMIELARPS